MPIGRNIVAWARRTSRWTSLRLHTAGSSPDVRPGRILCVPGRPGPQNFVLADDRCNSKKRDRLPACDHLAAWVERNARYGSQLADALEPHGIVSELAASNRVAQWAPGQTEAAHGLTWVRADEMVPLAAGWRSVLSV
jgi:hypothetical protein